MSVRWVDGSANVSRVEHAVRVNRRSEAEVYDSLPSPVRALLRTCVSDLSASDAAGLVRQFGPRNALHLIKAADRAAAREVLAEHYPGHPRLAAR
jgi:hypothetical protein